MFVQKEQAQFGVVGNERQFGGLSGPVWLRQLNKKLVKEN